VRWHAWRLELRPPRTSSLRFAFLTNHQPRYSLTAFLFARSFAIRVQLGEFCKRDVVQTVCPSPENGCYCWSGEKVWSPQFTAQG
jgi:hypothetical protein